MSDAWDPAVYERFKAERSQPFFDLIALVRAPTPRLVDLGCGTGELTKAAVEQLAATSALGIDNSPSMLRDAETHALPGRLSFQLGDLATWTSAADVDVIVANASLHWAPDHAGVLRRWTAALAPGGQLVVQVPTNASYPSHVVADEVAREEPFLSAFGPAGPPTDPVGDNVLTPVEYAQLLFDLGYEEQSVRLQIYAHVLPETRSVVDWVSGTMLTRFKKVLPADTYGAFVARYEKRLVEVLGQHRPFLFPFARILLWGRLPN